MQSNLHGYVFVCYWLANPIDWNTSVYPHVDFLFFLPTHSMFLFPSRPNSSQREGRLIATNNARVANRRFFPVNLASIDYSLSFFSFPSLSLTLELFQSFFIDSHGFNEFGAQLRNSKLRKHSFYYWRLARRNFLLGSKIRIRSLKGLMIEEVRITSHIGCKYS